MPDPIPSATPPDEPKRKSGFDPAQYEAEKAQSSESELTLRMRMYKAVVDVVEGRVLESPEAERKGDLASLKNGILYYTSEPHDNTYIGIGSKLKEKVKPFEQSSVYLRAVMLPVDNNGFFGYKSIDLGQIVARGIVDRDFIAISLNFDVTATELEESGNETCPFNFKHDEDKPKPNNLFTILIGPELPPTMIQERYWDRENSTWQQKLSAVDADGNLIYSRHELTDEECSKILLALKDSPLF